MKPNQTMLAVGAVLAIVLAVGVLVYFIKASSPSLPPAVAPPANISYRPDPMLNKN